MEEEAELKKELAREKETNRLKSKLISITTHELKTPLTVIKTSIEICLLEASRLE
jgi:signal transduction histidine kinase